MIVRVIDFKEAALILTLRRHLSVGVRIRGDFPTTLFVHVSPACTIAMLLLSALCVTRQSELCVT